MIYKLQNNHHTKSITIIIFLLVMRTRATLAAAFKGAIQYHNCSHHAAHYILMPYFMTGNFTF